MHWKNTDLLDAIILLLLTAVFIALLASSAHSQTVIQIIDGQTIVLDDGRHVRIADIDASKDAMKMLRLYCLDRPIAIKDELDIGWGLTQARVYWRSNDIGAALVSSGSARATSDRYRLIESRAKESKKGIWQSLYTPTVQEPQAGGESRILARSTASPPVSVPPYVYYHHRINQPAIVCIGST